MELLQEVEEYFTLGVKVSPGDTVLDIGANVGAFSLRVAEQCQGDVTLLCFEPSPDTYAALRKNFEENPLLKRTRHTVCAVGITSREHAGQELSFYNFRRFPTNSTFDLAGKRREFEVFFEDRGKRWGDKVSGVVPGLGRPLQWMIESLPKGKLGWWGSKLAMGFEEVKARLETLDEVLLREKVKRVDLLKIDVEGPELEVLRGLGPSTWPLINQVVIETNNRDGRKDLIVALLAANGLTKVRTAAQTTIDNGLESVLLLAER